MNELAPKVKKLRTYFNNHYGDAAVINAIQFQKMLGDDISDEKEQILQNAKQFYSEHKPTKNQIA